MAENAELRGALVRIKLAYDFPRKRPLKTLEDCQKIARDTLALFQL